MEDNRRRRGSGFLAFSATLILPGLGHWIVGARQRAAFWFVIWICLVVVELLALIVPRYVPMLVVAVPAHVVIIIFAFVDSYFIGRRSTHQPLSSPALRYMT